MIWAAAPGYLALSVVFYLVVVNWQPLWTEGFKDFSEISEAIMHLDKTAQPVAEMAPLMLGEMDAMRNSMMQMQRSMKTIEEINPNVKEMTCTMNRMTRVMDQRMGMMNNGMDRVAVTFLFAKRVCVSADTRRPASAERR